MASTRFEKEQFYRNHSGSSLDEILLVILVSWVGFCICCDFNGCLLPAFFLQVTGVLCKSHYDKNWFLQYTVLHVPVILSVSFPRYNAFLLPILFIVGLFLLWGKESVKGTNRLRCLNQPKKTFLTYYRAHMLLVTCICILAVDFPRFPRRFAKTETFGTSLVNPFWLSDSRNSSQKMDLGVGNIIFSGGLTSGVKYQGTTWKSALKTFKSSIPVVVLGLGRLLSVKGLEYHVN